MMMPLTLGNQVLDIGIQLGGIAIGIRANDLDIIVSRSFGKDGLIHPNEVSAAL